MTSYLATIRIEAFGLDEAKRIAEFIAGTPNALGSPEVVSVVQEPSRGPVELPPWPLTPRYVTEAIWKDYLEVGGKLAELFGFEFIDDVSLVKEPLPHLAYNAGGPIPKPQLLAIPNFASGVNEWVTPERLSLWERLRKWWKR